MTQEHRPDERERHLHDYLARTEQHLLSRPQSGELLDIGSAMLGDVLALHARCRSLFVAIRALVQAGLPEEGQILLRSLIESSLQVEYLATQDVPTREALMIRRRLHGVTMAFDLLDTQPKALGTGPGLTDEQRQVLETQRSQLQSRQKRLNVVPMAFPSDKDIALKLGRQTEYLDFLLGHQLTHGTALSQASRSVFPDKDTVQLYLRNFDFEALSGTGVAAANCALRSMAASEEIFGWEHEGTQALLDEAASF